MQDIFAQKYTDVISEITEQSMNPPGEDRCISNFYEAFLSLEKKDARIKDLIQKLLVKREISTKHFVNLLFRGVQYIELFEIKNPSYPKDFDTSLAWEREMDIILTKFYPIFNKILLTRETGTTIYQRYAGPKFILSTFFQNRPLSIVDFGAGGRYGLRGMSAAEPFLKVVDHTAGSLVSNSLLDNLNIDKGLDIDKENPDLLSNVRWRMACGFYPSELGNFQNVVDFENRVKKTRNIKFLQKDILDLTPKDLNGSTNTHSYDAVILSTVLYQMPDVQDRMLDNAKELLNKDGLIIVQDFAIKDIDHPEKLNFKVKWFGQDYSYRTFIIGVRTDWKFLEVLRWFNGRCKEVAEGEDFEKAIQKPPVFGLNQAQV